MAASCPTDVVARSRSSRCHACRDRANHSLTESGRADTEREVEPTAEVLERDHMRQFDELLVVELPPQSVKELVRDLDRRPAHADGIVENQFLAVGKELARPIRR